MANKKYNLVWATIQTIGIPQILAYIIGVPAMITGILVVWHSLSTSFQITLGVSSGLVLLAIGLFIYGQTRKVLYNIPNILHQMHLRRMELATHLTLKEIDFAKFMSLVGINSDELFATIKDFDELLSSTPKLVEIAETQSEKAKTEQNAPQRIFHFFYEEVGLKKASEQDKIYQNLEQQLNKIQPIVPSEEISQAMLEYDKVSRIFGTFLPIFTTIDTQVLELLPLSYQIDRTLKVDELNDKMKLLLSKVRESIDKYYKGK